MKKYIEDTYHIFIDLLNNQRNYFFIHEIFFSVFMSESQVSNHLGSKWTTEEYIQWNVMIEVLIEVSKIKNYIRNIAHSKLLFANISFDRNSDYNFRKKILAICQ